MSDIDQETLDQYLAAQAADGEERIQGYGRPAAPAVAPAPDAPINDSEINALMRKAYGEAMANDPTPPQLADVEQRLSAGSAPTAPGLNPFSGFGNAVAQASQGRAKLIADNPYVSLGRKLDAQRSAGLAGMAGSVLNNLADKKRADYELQMDADLKRAQAFRALHPGNRGAASTSLGVINAAQRDKLMAANQAKYDAKVAAAEAAADPKSEVSEAFRTAAYKTGIWQPGELDDMSKDQIAAARVARMQTARIDAQGSEADRKLKNEHVLRGQQAEEAEQRAIADENRKETRRREQASIDGVVWKGDKVPDDKAVGEVRTAAEAHSTLVQGNRRLAEIQRELENESRISGVPIRQIDAYLGTDRAKNLMAEAEFINNRKLNAIRNLENFGVPQQFELDLINRYNTAAGSLGALFNGPANWEQGARSYNQALRNKMKLRNAYFVDDPALLQGVEQSISNRDPASQVTRFPRGEFQPYQPRAGGAPAQKEPLPDVPAVSEKLPTAPVPAQSLPAGKKYLVLTKNGWTKTPVSKEDADRAMAAGFATEVKEAK
jgi:hypothetical protein